MNFTTLFACILATVSVVHGSCPSTIKMSPGSNWALQIWALKDCQGHSQPWPGSHLKGPGASACGNFTHFHPGDQLQSWVFQTRSANINLEFYDKPGCHEADKLDRYAEGPIFNAPKLVHPAKSVKVFMRPLN
ncbi:hypothetical protein BJ138DRAFT_1178044 [Hygrophoropsis aurantiaca]|uniref:Uncharacterized protein n=1 Tax=Hygrophoropsis aurantiaca TaxID=72124 RepID=A0ACB8AJX6_9AGAM|nr:hypothetical protein BJ138DRAFT_1178044 [Hygrophoropsis aurantiaca]